MLFKTKRALRSKLLGATLVFFGTLNVAHAQCQGKDFLEGLKTSNPKAYEKIQKEAANTPFAEGKLFSVTKEGYAPSYIFGTMHSGEPRITQFSPKLLKALDQAQAIAFELKEVGGMSDPAVMQKLGEKIIPYIMASDDERISKLFTEEQKKEIEILAEKYGLSAASIDFFKPSFIGLSFSVPICESNQQNRPGVDALLAQRLTNMGKTFSGLETIEEQLQVIAGYEPETQRIFLLNALKAQPIGEDLFESTINLYQKGQIGLLLALTKSNDILPSDNVEEEKQIELITVRLVDERNKRMFERSLPMVQNGGAFIAVGAAHLPGTTGLLKLYENAGYKIEKIE